MKKTSAIGLCLLLGLTISAPAYSQRGGGGGGGNENNEYRAIQDEQNFQRKLQLVEAFLSAHRDSQFRPDMDKLRMDLYVKNSDWGKMVIAADQFRLEVPSADA